MAKKIKGIGISDLHFENPRIHQEGMYLKLCKYLYPQLTGVDILCIVGDLFDHLLTVNNVGYRYARMFITDLLTISAKTGMEIRILHGTYTHDRNQVSSLEIHGIPGAKVKIINNISTEKVAGMNVLYVPDNLPYKYSEDAITAIKEVIHNSGMKNVDLVFGHGTFRHTLPDNIPSLPSCTFDAAQFESICPNGHVIMGHVHERSHRWFIWYCGSFERMSHGEEGPKGFLTFERSGKTRDDWKFAYVDNEKAIPFVTISPKGKDSQGNIDDFHRLVKKKIPDLIGYVRVIHKDPEIRSLLEKICRTQYPDLRYSAKSDVDPKKTVVLNAADVVIETFEEVKPTAENLGHLVCQFLEDKKAFGGLAPADILEEINKLLLMK